MSAAMKIYTIQLVDRNLRNVEFSKSPCVVEFILTLSATFVHTFAFTSVVLKMLQKTKNM